MKKPVRVSKSSSNATAAGGAKPVPSRAAKTSTPAAARRPAATAKVAAPRVKAAAKPATPARKPVVPGRASTKPTPPKPGRIKKVKLVDVKFTMPESEYKMLAEVKKACGIAGFAVKKSELLRAGMGLLKSLDHEKLKQAVSSLPPLKAVRPKAKD